MRKCIFLFSCVLALASCSPKIYSGVQDVRALDEARRRDSIAFERRMEARLQELVEQRFERIESQQTETVHEVYSAPDTSGHQYVVERSTTHTVAGSSTVASSYAAREQQLLEKTDSVAVADSSKVEQLEIHEEEEIAPAPAAKRTFWDHLCTVLVILCAGGCFWLGYKVGRVMG